MFSEAVHVNWSVWSHQKMLQLILSLFFLPYTTLISHSLIFIYVLILYQNVTFIYFHFILFCLFSLSCTAVSIPQCPIDRSREIIFPPSPRSFSKLNLFLTVPLQLISCLWQQITNLNFYSFFKLISLLAQPDISCLCVFRFGPSVSKLF